MIIKKFELFLEKVILTKSSNSDVFNSIKSSDLRKRIREFINC